MISPYFPIFNADVPMHRREVLGLMYVCMYELANSHSWGRGERGAGGGEADWQIDSLALDWQIGSRKPNAEDLRPKT